MDFAEMKDVLHTSLINLKSICHELDMTVESQQVESLTSQILEDRPARIVIVGEFNCGKSTLVNALCRTSVLPTGIIPTTATINLLSYSDTPYIKITYLDDTSKEFEYSEDTLKSLTARYGDQAEIRWVEIKSPSIPQGLILIDTPGVNDVNDTRSEIVYQMLPDADAILFVMDIQQALKQSEIDFLKNRILGTSLRKTLFVLNHVDRVGNENEISMVQEFVINGLRDIYYQVANKLRTQECESLAKEIEKSANELCLYTISAKLMQKMLPNNENDRNGLYQEVKSFGHTERKNRFILEKVEFQTLNLVLKLEKVAYEKLNLYQSDTKRIIDLINENGFKLKEELKFCKSFIDRTEKHKKRLALKANNEVERFFDSIVGALEQRLRSEEPNEELAKIQSDLAKALEIFSENLNRDFDVLASELGRDAITNIHLIIPSMNYQILNDTQNENDGIISKIFQDPINMGVLGLFATPILFAHPVGALLVAAPILASRFVNTEKSSVDAEQIKNLLNNSKEQVLQNINKEIDNSIKVLQASVIDMLNHVQLQLRSACNILLKGKTEDENNIRQITNDVTNLRHKIEKLGTLESLNQKGLINKLTRMFG